MCSLRMRASLYVPRNSKRGGGGEFRYAGDTLAGPLRGGRRPRQIKKRLPVNVQKRAESPHLTLPCLNIHQRKQLFALSGL